jgi:hypothetical protein
MLLRQFNPCPQKTYPCSGDGILAAQPSNFIGPKSTIKTTAEVHNRYPDGAHVGRGHQERACVVGEFDRFCSGLSGLDADRSVLRGGQRAADMRLREGWRGKQYTPTRTVAAAIET